MNQEGVLIWGIVSLLMLVALGLSAWAGAREGAPVSSGREIRASGKKRR